MKPAPRRWQLPASAPLAGFTPVLGQLFAARGYDPSAARAIAAGTAEHHDPFALAGMPEAVIAIALAVQQHRRIAVYGDYDADGVTACAMLTQALRAAGAEVIPYIPNRMTEGYGLHAPALVELAQQGVECVITVDCGTSSIDVAAGRPEGMALVITDHHLAPAPGGGPVRLPVVDALVNPKRPDCSYPFDALAGAGVAWKLLEALESEGVVPRGSAEASVALAALGTVADMMPLRGENRALVRAGLAAMSSDPSPGLRALIAAAGVRAPVRSSDIAFMLAPRINAAGRMEDAELALRLVMSELLDDAMPLAAQLHTQNAQRQQAVARALAEAEERVADLPDDLPAIVLGDPGWPMGIVGLVAGRLVERYARPAFIVCLDPQEAKGSARSVRGVHIVNALDQASQTLVRYGGHAVAAGFSLDAARFDDFAHGITEAIAAQLGDAPRERVFTIDAVVGLRDITTALVTELAVLEPCGQGNHEPLLALTGAVIAGTGTFGADRKHVRVYLGDGTGSPPVEAIAFNKPGLCAHLPVGRRVDAIFGLEIDRWDGVERVRCRLRDIRPARAATVEVTGAVVAGAVAAQAVSPTA